jgi:AraC-like DNA-binding protein
MNLIDLETPASAERCCAPPTDDMHPFYITDYGKTFPGTPCYQLRLASPVSCIQYVVSGSGVILYGDKFYSVKTGDTFWLSEGRDQIYYSNPDNQFARIWINFVGALPEALRELYKIQDTVVFQNTDCGELLEQLHTLCRQTPDPKEYKEKTAQGFLQLVQFLSNNRENGAEESSAMEEMRAFLDVHILENLPLSQIAAHFSFTKEHFIRVFRKTYGITPHQYILQSRIRIAMMLLISTDEPISRISEKLNFSDPHHFSDTFQKYVGFRPSQYRNLSRI